MQSHYMLLSCASFINLCKVKHLYFWNTVLPNPISLLLLNSGGLITFSALRCHAISTSDKLTDTLGKISASLALHLIRTWYMQASLENRLCFNKKMACNLGYDKFKGIVVTKIKTVKINSPPCCSKPVWHSFFCGKQRIMFEQFIFRPHCLSFYLKKCSTEEKRFGMTAFLLIMGKPRLCFFDCTLTIIIKQSIHHRPKNLF